MPMLLAYPARDNDITDEFQEGDFSAVEIDGNPAWTFTSDSTGLVNNLSSRLAPGRAGFERLLTIK